METFQSIIQSIQAPFFTISLYAPIAWKKSISSTPLHTPSSHHYHRKSSSSSSWHMAATFPVYLRDFIAQRQKCVLTLREKILSTADLASIHPGILCPPLSPNGNSSSISSEFNEYFSSSTSSSLQSLTAAKDASTDSLLQGLFLYDAIQTKLSAAAVNLSDTDKINQPTGSSHLSFLLIPLLQSMTEQDLKHLLLAIRALHHTLRAHLNCVLNSGDWVSIPDTQFEMDNNFDLPYLDNSSSTTNTNKFDDLYSPSIKKSKIKGPITSEMSDTSTQTPYYSTSDFKIDGLLRLGANSILAILNMCSGACPFLDEGGNMILSSSPLSSSSSSSSLSSLNIQTPISEPINCSNGNRSTRSLSNLGITISNEDRDMVRECLERYVDTSACASRRNGSTIGSTSSNGHGCKCCELEPSKMNQDGKCEWERVIESVISGR